MKIRAGTMALTGTALLLQCFYAAQVGAYNPNEDPNVVQQGAELSPSRSAQIATLVGEFERLQPSSSPSRDGSPSAPQPELYARSESQPAPAQPSPYGTGPDPYMWGGYSYWNTGDPFSWSRHYGWASVWPHSSPRIPWWSLLRFTKH